MKKYLLLLCAACLLACEKPYIADVGEDDPPVVVPGDGLLPVTESSSLKAGLRVDRVGVAGAGRDNLTYELLP